MLEEQDTARQLGEEFHFKKAFLSFRGHVRFMEAYRSQYNVTRTLQTACNHLESLLELERLWKDRTKHGAGRQNFGKKEEAALDDWVDKLVPSAIRPNKKAPLQIDRKFITYCKAVIWNKQKSLGKKITREKSIRSGIVSLSEYDYLVSDTGHILDSTKAE